MIPMTSTTLPPVPAGGEIGAADGAAASLGFLEALLAALPPEAQGMTEQELADWLQVQDAGLADLEALPVSQQAAALLGLIESSRQTLPVADEGEATLADATADVPAAELLGGQPLQNAAPIDGAEVGIDADAVVPARAYAYRGAALAPAQTGDSAAAPSGLEANALAGAQAEPAAASPEAGREVPAAVAEQTFRPLLQTAAAGVPEGTEPESQLRVPVRHPEFGQAVGERLMWMVRNEMQEAKIRLDPPHLGPLEISVSVKDDRADVLIQAAHALTREALDAELPRLRMMLADAGFASVDVGVARDQGGQAAGEQRREAGQHQTTAGMDDAEATEPVPVRTARGLIDHYA